MNDPESLIGLVAVGGTAVVAICITVCMMIVSLYKTARHTSLKLAMVEAGMSGSEIERVLNAGNPTAAHSSEIVAKIPPKQSVKVA